MINKFLLDILLKIKNLCTITKKNLKILIYFGRFMYFLLNI
jgi:hypothetical protein